MADWDLPRDPLEALQQQDPAPFEAFVHSHVRVLFAFFRRLGASPTQAEDLTQEVLLKLYDHAPRYRPEGRFRALVYRVARNLWIDARRRAGRREPPARGRGVTPDGGDEPTPERPAHDPGPSERAVRREELERLRVALARLAEPHRRVFELGVVDGVEYGEIARLLDIPVGTVKSRMHHAVRKLRRALGEEGA